MNDRMGIVAVIALNAAFVVLLLAHIWAVVALMENGHHNKTINENFYIAHPSMR